MTRDVDQVAGDQAGGRQVLLVEKNHAAAIVDSADDAIISKDLNGIVETWNQGARRMFGYTSEEMTGQPMLRLIPKELHYEEEEILKKLRAGERIDHYETTRMRKNGELIEVSVVGKPHPDWGEEVIAFVVVRDGSQVGERELDALCLEQIARFKRPKSYRFVPDLPKNNYGKVLKTSLRESLGKEAG